MPIVDAHPHIYSPDRNAYPTIEEPWEPGEPASVQDLKKRMDALGVDRAVFIQTSTFYGHDNRYVMDSAKEHAEWACGVVTLDPDDASHLDVLEDAVKNSNIRGMRGTADAIGRISSMGVYRLWTKAMELGIPVNCMVMDDLDRVPEIERIASDLGDLKIVIDHCLMLNTRHRTEETLIALERLAKHPNIYAKLTSGTHGSYRVYPFVDMHDPLKRVIEAFEPNRCVWGSNFPNALWSKGASYAQNLHLFVKELGLSLPDKAHILGTTAMSLWFPAEQEQMQRAAREQKERTEREAVKAREVTNASDEDEIADPDELDARTAEVTNIADIISSEKSAAVEAGKSGENELDLNALLDVTNQLSAALGPMDKQPTPDSVEDEEVVAEATEPDAETDLESMVEPDVEPELEPEPEEPAKDPVTVKAERKPLTVEELLGEEEATPKKIARKDKLDETADDDEEEFKALLDVADQVNRNFESVEEPPQLSIEDATADSTTDETPAVNLEELMASQNYTPIKTDEIGKSEEPGEGDDEMDLEALLDVANQLNSALESVDEPGEVSNDSDEAESTEESKPTVDVEALLAAQASTEADAAVAPAESADEDDEFVVAALMDVANQLNSALELNDEEGEVSIESEDEADPADGAEPTIDVEALLAAQEAAETNADAAGEAVEEAEPTIDVEALLAAQDAAEAEPDAIVEADEPVEDDEFDVSALMDVANQLNSMLESVDDLASDIADAALEAAEDPGEDARSSA